MSRLKLLPPFLALVLFGLVPCRANYRDVATQWRCNGSLGKYASCQCQRTTVTCINTQLTDTDVFLLVDRNHYKYLTKITFHGNNFVQLPFTPLFGHFAHDRLLSLNISANYIVQLHSAALQGMPNLVELDLSNNEIVLKEDDIGFLSHTRKLLRLYFRRTFNQSINRTVQFDLMERMFADARLDQLILLDLSYNFFRTVPFNLGCHFPALTHLDLRQNLLSTLSVNVSCLQQLETLDLRTNLMHVLDRDFRQNVANQLGDYTLTLRNAFHCDCRAHSYISWIRTTSKVRDKDSFRCAKASPGEFVGAKLMTIPLDRLDCSVDLTKSSLRDFYGRSNLLLILVIGCFCFYQLL